MLCVPGYVHMLYTFYLLRYLYLYHCTTVLRTTYSCTTCTLCLLQLIVPVHISTCVMNCVDPDIHTTTIDNHVVPFFWHKQHIALFLHTDCDFVVQSWHDRFNKSQPSNSCVVCPPSWKCPCWVYRQRVNGRRKQIPLLLPGNQSIPCTVLVVMES